MERIDPGDWKRSLETLFVLIAPLAPHLGEELWHKSGYTESIFCHTWPSFDEKSIQTEYITVVVQINGKVRAHLEVDANISEDYVKKVAFENDKVKKYTEGKIIQKVVYVKKKLLSIVVKD